MSHFFAILSRMKLIRRWSLMYNRRKENVQEHALETALLAYHLCVLHNTYFEGHVNCEHAAVLAMYHDATEVFTGDMPTPVKYFTPHMRQTYGDVEKQAALRLLSTLPQELQQVYEPLICQPEADPVWPFVKAADILSAYLKCVQEVTDGNHEFNDAFQTLEARLQSLHLPEVTLFLKEYAPSFRLSLDQMHKV
ncbi:MULTISPECIES: 5'-deoxynucleotidase [Megasphaera]|nr:MULTISPECIES: 5'-deoxynucleotidase [Megasphaera]EGS33167.1 hypothetical protein HMPREF1040_1531 [Megasphaera sp. UPII 135-E]MUP48213.1 5'-deoxynucleotidase [Veillonellaceae bacterium M2-8]